MANTLPIQAQHIEAYHNGKFIGYVNKIRPRGQVVACDIKQFNARFAKRKAESVKRSAETSTVCYVEGMSTLYTRKDNVTFKMVPVTKTLS